MPGIKVAGAYRALTILFVAAPLFFASLRALTTGTDFRYFWVALASLAGAVAITAVTSRSIRRRVGLLAAGVFIVATTSAVLAALLLGTRMGPGLMVVAAAFGCCVTVGAVLHTIARSR